MTKEQLKKELNKLKALQSGLKKKWQGRKEFKLILTTEEEISQIPSKIEKHPFEDSQVLKVPERVTHHL